MLDVKLKLPSYAANFNCSILEILNQNYDPNVPKVLFIWECFGTSGSWDILKGKLLTE